MPIADEVLEQLPLARNARRNHNFYGSQLGGVGTMNIARRPWLLTKGYQYRYAMAEILPERVWEKIESVRLSETRKDTVIIVLSITATNSQRYLYLKASTFPSDADIALIVLSCP